MSEQQKSSTEIKCPHPWAVGDRWGDPISEERKAELQGYLDRWEAETNHGAQKGPFGRASAEGDAPRLTGADVMWLADQSGPVIDDSVKALYPKLYDVPNLHLEGANLIGAHLEQAILRGAHLEDALLIGAWLIEANLVGAHLESADLYGASLEGAWFGGAYLGGADLGRASFDGKTTFSEDTTLNAKTKLGGISWNGVGNVNLTDINWELVPILGDERDAGLLAGADAHEAVVRAYRQVAAQLRAQGMGEVADRFLYRANVRQRGVLLRRWRIPQYFGSLLLDIISGYGYRPIRSLIAYILVIIGFAAAYFALGGANGQALTWNEAIVISMTAFHGRGFFQTAFQPGDLQAAVAAGEAFIGLLIEIVLIATFTQRFFAR